MSEADGQRATSREVCSQARRPRVKGSAARFRDAVRDGLLGPVAHATLRLALPRHGEKRIAAMVRVKDEEEFLYPAIESIVDYVEEVVIVDNLSSDGSPAIIRSLQQEHPHEVRCYQYNHPLARRGQEHWQLASSDEGRVSPRLSSTYYNWCLERCSEPYILKWDGDMIATAAFHDALETWRHSDKALLSVKGANVHPDRIHLIGARLPEPAPLARALAVPELPKWIGAMSYTSPEWRLFPRFRARYTCGVWWTQTLATPFLNRLVRKRFAQSAGEPCYLHLRFCKRDPYTGYSADFEEVVRSNLALGPELLDEWKEVLRRWNL